MAQSTTEILTDAPKHTPNHSAEYDLIVLGGGAVGENIADRAVQGGCAPPRCCEQPGRFPGPRRP